MEVSKSLEERLKDDNGVYKPNVTIKDYEDLFPDISITKELLEAYENADIGYGDMKFEVDPTKYPLIADEDGYYKVPVKITMPSFIKGNKEAEERWNELSSTDMIFRPPFIDYDSVQQVYPNITPMSFEERNCSFIGRNICRRFTESISWVDDSAFLGYNCWFTNLIKTRRTKHGKRKLIPYKASKVLFKNVKPMNIENNFSYSN